MNKSQIVQVVTSDNLYLQGFFAPSQRKTAVLHIHGFEGNFYENKFAQVLADKLENGNITFLTVNTRGSGKIKTVGARYELLEEANEDIDAWINFLAKNGYDNIILQGHSLGTYKAVRYFLTGRNKNLVKKLILLAPFDKKGMLKVAGYAPIDKLLNKAQRIVAAGKGDEMITDEFDSIVVSYKTYMSWYKQDDLGRIVE